MRCVGREVSIVREVKIMEAKLRDRALGSHNSLSCPIGIYDTIDD